MRFHALSLPQDAVVPYRNSTALDIDCQGSVSECWRHLRRADRGGIVCPALVSCGERVREKKGE